MSSLLYLLIPVGIGAGIYLIRKLREYQWGWVRNNSSLRGKLFIVTGSNTGLGYEVAKALVTRQASVIMACRNMEKASQAIANIRQETTEGELIPLELDLASFESIHKFAAEIKDKYSAFDCLINNAGLAVQTPQYTKENYEVHTGVNHLGHFLLVDLLKDNIKSNSARVVIVSSKMHEKNAKIDFDSFGKWVDRARGDRFNNLYNNSKLMNFYFAREMYKKGYDVHVLCPGLCHTDFFRDYNPKWYHYVLFAPIVWMFLRSAKQGAQNIIHCATDNVNTVEKNPATGYFVTNLKQTKSKVAFDDQISEKLWRESAREINSHGVFVGK
ncbi:retinol dehydrogenase 13 isoform X3 [Topomyia yanbarensis]|uniref:retinol dehydrogenase 13 isoform X3 n=1 Tax=Topomyia yanbarensis TaxID=2498891 RepID=UPI00273B7483|nr:retinol dehydrogenase 13 isoform X3 [Topomyia yanbarensis]XP_058831900.1 retinol dehydrogenase 13 isoform X3 [Topomyia yanbarensis]